MKPNQSGEALVTGASSGIGWAFARRLADAGYSLTLTARREDRLQELTHLLREEHGTRAKFIVADLSIRRELEELEALVGSMEALNLLVNNAGFGVSGDYVSQPIEKHQRMIDVHVSATVRLTHAALPGMLARKHGHIINVSSIAAFIPSNGGPGYSASKAYINTFSSNLDSFVRREGVGVQALCPGYTYTEFHSSSDYQGKEREVVPKWVWMSAEEVVDYSLGKLSSGQVIVIPGWQNRLTARLLRTGIGKFLMALRPRMNK